MLLTCVALFALTSTPTSPSAPSIIPIHIGDAGTKRPMKLDQTAAVNAAKKALTDRKVDTSKLNLSSPSVRIIADGATWEVTFNPAVPGSKGGVVIVQIDGETGDPLIAFGK